MTGSARSTGAPAVSAPRPRHVHLPRPTERTLVVHDPATGTVAYRHPIAGERIGRAGRRERGGQW